MGANPDVHAKSGGEILVEVWRYKSIGQTGHDSITFVPDRVIPGWGRDGFATCPWQKQGSRSVPIKRKREAFSRIDALHFCFCDFSLRVLRHRIWMAASETK